MLLHVGIPVAIRIEETEIAARVLGLRIRPIEISCNVRWTTDSPPCAMPPPVADRSHRPDFFSQRQRIVELAAGSRLLAMHFFQEFVEAGGLMSYGPSDTTCIAAPHLCRSDFKGARPSELPVEQPIKSDLAVISRPPRRSASNFADGAGARDKVIE